MRTALALLALTMAGCIAPITDTFRANDVEAPTWRVGDWWTYRMTSDVYATEGDVTVVVANVTGDEYVLGVPADDDATFALLQHLPAIGPVRKDLSWEVHGTRFEPLRFPLEEGATWDATWIETTIHFRSRFANGTWNVTNAATQNESLSLFEVTYDPAARAITRFVRTGLDGNVRVAIEMTANGTGYVGDVRTVGPIQVVLLESRTRGTLSGTTPSAPNPSFTAPEGVDTLLVGCLAGGAPGQYHAEVRSPTGVVCQLDETIQPGDATIRAQVVEASVEEGGWEARLAAVGPGSAVAEVLGYATSVVTLPAS